MDELFAAHPRLEIDSWLRRLVEHCAVVSQFDSGGIATAHLQPRGGGSDACLCLDSVRDAADFCGARPR